MTGGLWSHASPGRLLMALLVFAFGTAVYPASADDKGDAVALVETVRQAAMSSGPAEAQHRSISRAFDGTGIARTVLGTYWRGASAEDRAAVVDALLDAIARGLADRLERTSDQNFVVLGTKVLANGDILVRSEFRRPVRRAKAVDWRVRRCGQRLCIGDVFVDGGSVTLQKRDRIADRLAGNGGSIAALVVDLRKGRI